MNRKIVTLCAIMLVIIASVCIICVNCFAVQSTFSFADTLDVKTVYLTFDDGPSDRVTPKILDVLKKENVKATFFIIGKQAKTRQNLLKRIYGEGHTLAVHSYTHEYSSIYASETAIIEDIDRCNDLIYAVTGRKSNIYRFPGGSFNLPEKLIEAVKAHGMRYVDWNASMRDAEIINPTAHQLYKAAITSSADTHNVVLLAHDSTTKTATAEALPDIIKYYKQNGYTFSTF